MAGIDMSSDELAVVRETLLRAVSAIDKELIWQHDDVGILARMLRQCCDECEFDEGIDGDSFNRKLERWLNVESETSKV